MRAQEIQDLLPTEVAFQRALGPISAKQGDAVADTFFTRVSDKAITKAFIKCELEDLNLKLGKPSLQTYLRLGNKIRNSLSDSVIL
jgi:hypothetical protein